MTLCECGHARELHEVDRNCLDPECYCARYTARPEIGVGSMKQHIHADLRGDGRELVHPNPTRVHVYAGHPKIVPLRIARTVVAAFQRAGHSTHSPAGELCWILQDWCTENQVGLDVVEWIEKDTRPDPITPNVIRGYTLTRVDRKHTVRSQRFVDTGTRPLGDDPK